MVCDTQPSQDAITYQIWNSYLKEYKRYAPFTITLKTRSEVKVTVTQKWYVTLSSQYAFTHQIWNSYLKEYRRYAPDSMQFLETRSEVKFKVTVTQLWHGTLPHLKMYPHTKFEIPTSNNMRYALDTIILKTRSEVKVTVTRKWYTTLRYPKMHPHIKFGIPTSKKIGDMHRTQSERDGQCVYYKNYARGQGHSDPKLVCDTPPSQDNFHTPHLDFLPQRI